jgi:cytosine/adenosine deaminase-related metal-dependent hydrolase
MPDARLSLRARWIIPVEGEPIENGTIEIADGRIVDLHELRHPQSLDLGNAAIIPGLVNAHTHLEFSGLARPLQPAQPFAAWIRALVAERRRGGPDSTAAIAQGMNECAAAGTTTVGEIATSDVPDDFDTTDVSRVVAFRELIGRFPEQADDLWDVARRHLEQWRTAGRPDVIAGLSPHAPYSVHPDLLRRLVDLACEFRAPVAMHVAETRDELELLDRGTGHLRTMLEDFGVWREGAMPVGARPLDALRELQRLPRALVIHGNYLADDEIAFLAERLHLAVVYCPRTHHFFGHSEHPWRLLLARGVSLALGTDGRASNPDLSLWHELQFLSQRFRDVSRRTLLELGSIRGARALGLDHETGSLTVGKSADLAVVALKSGAAADPHDLVLSSVNEIVRTMRAGQWLADRRLDGR